MDTVDLENDEQLIVEALRILPPDRKAQLVDFARFLEAQILAEALLEEETPSEIKADNARWEALLETDEAQDLLGELAIGAA